ncbi:MAG: isoprenylcysteine carboxylmethyltransferase family protein [Nitrosomonas sp.]|uniref:methyltransferase family protein n=1 Tax=Nitrosomonas sp. TaxID=42353 RepID=UPI002733D5E5|nr:isoprenylcysteine carboxylmethyltransferase family protein [Nitrosomonas sp.]MDP3663312.1 isoprenylcysteine carboxylmethyltransferase family protein [Nitrosomonas sp.]MDZ4104844.1 isoprenylcysteine carboxylmethyltransferase family protein [Nitrosomonas sp.]
MFRLELKIPPVALVALFALAIWFVARMSPWAGVQIPGSEWVALMLLITGFALIIAGAVVFISAKTTVNPMTPRLATSIVSSGIYKLSRNPMYVGLFIMLAAWVIFLGNILSALLLPLFILCINRFQIIPEENALLEKFGDGYVDYLKSVRRWL